MTAIAEREVARTRNVFRVDGKTWPRIGVLYPSGAGNLGDEAILESTFAAIRSRWPNADIRAFTLYPTRTAANHGVNAEALTGLNRKLYGAPRPDGSIAVRAAAALARRTKRVPLIGTASRWAEQFVSGVVFETASLRSAWSWLKTGDLVLVSGGGQLDAVWGGTWGQPYALARWAWMARRAKVPFAFLSVGYGGVKTRLSRRFIRYAVSNAAYCSVRDAGSRVLTQQLGVTVDMPVVPDLAFGLHAERPTRPRRPGYDIAISPMVYLAPGSWPTEDPAAYQRYVSLWANITRDCVADGDRAHLFVTDPADVRAVDDVWARLDSKTRDGCTIVHVTTPRELLAFFSRVDVVISSRLHGVLLAIVAGRPVLALSHERKVRTVMQDADMTRFTTELSTATPGQVRERLERLVSELDTSAWRLRAYATSAAAAVKQQEEMLPKLVKTR